jgi:hypothetical protein
MMQIHQIILLLCNTHAQDNIFHLILFENKIIILFWFCAIPYGHNDNIISNHIHIYITFMKIMHIL